MLETAYVLDFNDWLRDKAEAHELTRVSQNRSRIGHGLRRLQKLVSINHLQMFLPLLQKLKNHFMIRALSARVNTHSGVVLCLRKRPKLKELNSPHKIGCVLLAFNLATCFENAI